jgi:hypothetical protein
MAAVAMVTKVQNMLNGNRTADPFETWRKNSPIWAKFGFQVDYDVANWYPLFGSYVMILQIISYLVWVWYNINSI